MLRLNHIGKTCPYCQYPIKQSADVSVCSVCLIPHHTNCWQENERCTTFGCRGIPSHLSQNEASVTGHDDYGVQRLNVDLESPADSTRQIESQVQSARRENILGIISFTICVLIALVFLYETLNESFVVPNELIIIASLAAFTFGVFGLFRLNQKKVFAGLGAFFSVFFIAITVISFVNDNGDMPFFGGVIPINENLEPSFNGDSNGLHINVPEDYETIQDAINNAQPGEVIIVEPGTYRENINFLGKDLKLHSNDPNDSAIVAATIIDGGNSGTVVTFSNGESRNAELKGFTITGGTGTRDSYSIISYDGERLNFERLYGGGILVAGGSEPIIANNIIIDNSVMNLSSDVVGVGGGIAVLDGSSPLIDNNTISDNYAEAFGGGLAVWYKSKPSIKNNIIENNRTDDVGGGILVAMMCSPDISDNTIRNNHSSNWAGGVYVAHMSGANIIGNSILNNTAFTGAGIFIRRTDGVVAKENELIGNQARRNGGAIYIDNRGTASVENNYIENNKALSGGAIWVDSDSQVLLTSPDSNNYQGNLPDNIVKK